MQIKGGIASKGEARVDANGRLLVDVAGGEELEYQAFIRHIATANSPIAMTVNVAPQDFSLPDLMLQKGTPFGTYSAPEFTFTEAGTYRVELLLHWEAGVDPPVSPDAQVLVALDDGGGYATLFRLPAGASDEADTRDQSYNFFVRDFEVGDKLKVQEHALNATALNMESVVWSIEKVRVTATGSGSGTTLQDEVSDVGAGSAVLSTGYQSVPGGAGGPLTVTAPVAGRYLVSYQVHSIMSNVEVVSEMGARITLNGSPITGTDINCGRNQTLGIGAVRHGNGNTVALDLAANDVIELEVFASPGNGEEQVASFANSGITQLRLIHYG